MHEPAESSRQPAQALPLIEESLEVEKVLVDRGGYRLTKRVGSRDETVEALLQTHQAEIERRPVGRDLQPGETSEPRYEGETLVVPVVEEVLVTTRKLRLVEEIRITPRRGTRRETRTVALRTEEIQIQRLAADAPSAAETSAPPPVEGPASTAHPGMKESR